MGSIRTLLALAVVFGHADLYLFTGGTLAVQLFYVISGYLMSLILLSKSYDSLRAFYINRFLRLFPIYWMVAILTGCVYLVLSTPSSQAFWSVYKSLGVDSLWLTLTNIFLFGQDWIMFTGVENGDFGWSSNFQNSEVLVWQGLLVPQAWTLGVELSFYLIAPFILRDKRRWMLLLAASLLLRVYFIYIGLGTKDPFSYRFFPLEISLFLLGAFSHQYIKPVFDSLGLAENRSLISFVTLFFIAIILVFHLVSIHSLLKPFLLIGSFTLALPLLAKFQQGSDLDDWIGSFSYPIYICHWVVIDVTKYLVEQGVMPYGGLAFYSAILVTTLGFAYLLESTISNKVESLRALYRRK
jgi:peptidoglycan/LPS O-acetylase OafA/YrhL